MPLPDLHREGLFNMGNNTLSIVKQGSKLLCTSVGDFDPSSTFVI